MGHRSPKCCSSSSPPRFRGTSTQPLLRRPALEGSRCTQLSPMSQNKRGSGLGTVHNGTWVGLLWLSVNGIEGAITSVSKHCVKGLSSQRRNPTLKYDGYFLLSVLSILPLCLRGPSSCNKYKVAEQPKNTFISKPPVRNRQNRIYIFVHPNLKTNIGWYFVGCTSQMTMPSL